MTLWKGTPEEGCKFNLDRPNDIYLSGVSRKWYVLALMDLFGLMVVDHPRAPIMTWLPAGLRHDSFGDAVLTLIAGKFLDSYYGVPLDAEDGEAARKLRFGVWQPLFQPFFPEWGRNLELPRDELRKAMFIFRISLGKVWRLIAVPSDATLADLADGIVNSVDFDNDHLFEFTYRDRLGAKRTIHHHAMDKGPWADDVTVGKLALEPGQTMTFLFDFGDCWNFDVKLERVEPDDGRKEIRILERHGKAPSQYPDWD
jgi:hypothetical protein